MDQLKLQEEEFERRARLRSLVTTVAFHLSLLLLLMLWTCSAPTPPPDEELVEVSWGSGGNPTVDAPDGPAQRGNPDAAASSSPRQTQDPRSRPETQRPQNLPRMSSPSSQSIPTPKQERPAPSNRPSTRPSTSTPSTTPSTSTPSTSSGDNPREGGTQSGPVGDNPNGTGSRPAGGSGGASVGSASGMGSRGWIRRPNARYPSGSNATGSVTLRFNVSPSGVITGITAIKRADAALVQAAIRGLSAAKAQPLPPDAPQESLTGATITFNFTLKD